MFTVNLLERSYPYGANGYMVSSEGEYLIIDPSSPPEKGIGAPKYILLTHSHFDHIMFVDEWAALGAKVLISEEEISGPSDPEFNCFKLFFGIDKGYKGEIFGLKEGQSITLGNETLTFMKTPGHTKGSSVFLIGNSCFVGDTVFAGGSYGRYDLPSGNFDDLKISINKILSMPEDTVLYPGHGNATTVKEYKKDYKRLV